MTKSGKRQEKDQQFEAARALILGGARVRRKRRRAAARVLSRGLRGVLVLLLVSILVGVLWLWFDERFYIYDVDVVGAIRVSPDNIFQASGLEGWHTLWVRSAEVEQRLLAALPNLERARVACKLPANCTITVSEWRPRMMWDVDGQLWWIGAEGVLFSAELPADGELAGGWMVRGPLPREEDGRLDERVRVALDELWKSGADVSPLLYYLPGRGLTFTDEQGRRIIVGRGAGIKRRMQVLEWLLSDLAARGLTPTFVDVRFPDAPYYSLTNEW